MLRRPSEEASAGKTPEQVAAEAQEAIAAASRKLLDSLKPEAVAAARALYDSSQTWADKAVALAPALDAKSKEAQAKVGRCLV